MQPVMMILGAVVFFFIALSCFTAVASMFIYAREKDSQREKERRQ